VKSALHRVLISLVVCAAAFAQAPGTKLTEITVNDTAGKAVTIPTAGKTTAIVFISTQCPVSNAYNERMAALYNDYKSRGVDFVFVNANATEPAAEVEKHIRDNGFGFKVYKDPDNRFADKLNAQVTPEAFLVERNSTIVYHGAIDDSQNAEGITKKPLREALEATLAGKAAPVAERKAFGCSIKRVKKQS